MTRKGPFQIIHDRHQTLVLWRGRLIHKRWPHYSIHAIHLLLIWKGLTSFRLAAMSAH